MSANPLTRSCWENTCLVRIWMALPHLQMSGTCPSTETEATGILATSVSGHPSHIIDVFSAAPKENRFLLLLRPETGR